MTPSSLIRAAAAAALAASLAAPVAAQEARAAKAVNLRAGPARDYPLVAQLGAGAPLAVQGCLDNYSWCDVVVPGSNLRGWIYAGNLVYPYQRTEVPLLEYGAAIGLPIVAFTLGSYWGDHYRNRPFFRDRGRWEHRPVPHGPVYGPGPRFGGHPPGRPIGPPGRPFEGRPGPGGRPGGFAPGPDRGPPPGAFRPPGGGRPDGGRPGGGPRGDGPRGGGPGGDGPRGGGPGGDRGHGGGRER